MGKLTLDITMSLDGFVAGPNQTLEQPLGEGGERLHEWVYGLASWRESHGLDGGERAPDDDVLEESVRATGAVLMGRRMFSGGAGPWEGDENAGGWWGDTPPFGVPVFILTHHAREPVTNVNVVQQYLRAGSIDELQIHVAPLLLGDGVRLFDELGAERPTLEATRVIESPAVTHIRYRVVR
jgi:dihydrofolate reductase